MHYSVDRDLSSGYCYPPFEQLGPGCLLPSQLVHIQALLLVVHFLLCSCCVNGASAETQGQIVGARESVNMHSLFFLAPFFFARLHFPPPLHPQLSAAGSPRMLQDVQGTAFPSFRIRFKITILMCEQNPYPDGVV